MCGIATDFRQNTICVDASPSFLKAIALLLSFAAPLHAYALELEPRYWWSVGAGGLGKFSSVDEAYTAYEAWENNNNLSRPPSYQITVVGYEPIAGATYNGRTSYAFRFYRPADCPNTCLGNSMSLQMQCPAGSSGQVTPIVPNVSYRYSCVFPAKPEPDVKDCPIGNPVFPASGTKLERAVDYRSHNGDLQFVRTYRSDRNSWTHNYEDAVLDLSGASDSHSRCWPALGNGSGEPYCFKFMANSSNE